MGISFIGIGLIIAVVFCVSLAVVVTIGIAMSRNREQ